MSLDQLATFVDSWVDYLGLIGLDNVRREQPAPWASLSLGAGGHAYALWYIAVRGGRPALLAGGQRWWKLAMRGAERRSGFYGKDFERWRLGGSVGFGRPGLEWMEALLADARGKPAACRRALARFAASVRRARQPYAEFNMGLGGALTAAVCAHRRLQAPEMRELADLLAARLVAATELPMGSFAHGRVGVQHALLAWAQHTGGVLPARLVQRLARPSVQQVIARDRQLAGSWCNGLTGFIFLWVKAFEVTRDEVWRARARDAARRLLAEPFTDNGTLCCGLGGQAYAMLALSRIDESEPWRDHATARCVASLARAETHGLARGLSGLACLAMDLCTPGEARYPLAEP